MATTHDNQKKNWVISVKKYTTLLILLSMILIFSLTCNNFFTKENFQNIIIQSSLIVITGLGWTLLLISGGMDLSVGGIVALSGVLSVGLSTLGLPTSLCYLIGILVGALVGVVNGTLSIGFGITPLIATLGTMWITRGLAFLLAMAIAGRLTIYANINPNFFNIAGSFSGIPVPIIIVAVLSVLIYIIQSRTVLGKYAYAVGGNPRTASYSGISVAKTRFLLYMLTGTLAGLSGVLLAARMQSGQPSSGQGFEFEVITAVCLGGASLAGGEGSVIGTIIGAFLVGVIKNAMNLIGLQSFYQQVILGCVLLFAVILDMSLKGTGFKWRNFKEIWH